jgi:hypothetical protein
VAVRQDREAPTWETQARDRGVLTHELGAAAYAIKAVRAAATGREGESAGRLECRWQREQLPDVIRELVLDDQRLRNEICWSVFDC